jgi:hypothetical protein
VRPQNSLALWSRAPWHSIGEGESEWSLDVDISWGLQIAVLVTRAVIGPVKVDMTQVRRRGGSRSTAWLATQLVIFYASEESADAI